MTWGEFKEKMTQRGVTDDTQIGYIDVGGDDEVDVTFAPTGEVIVNDYEALR